MDMPLNGTDVSITGSASRRCLRLVVVSFLLGCGLAMEATAVELSPVVTDSADWVVKPDRGTKLTVTNQVDTDGDFIHVGTAGLQLTRSYSETKRFELDLVVRATEPTSQMTAMVDLYATEIAKPSAANIKLNWYDRWGKNRMQYAIPAAGERPRAYGWRDANELPANRLTWPTNLREQVEALQTGEYSAWGRWYHVRMICTEQGTRIYMDDRFLGWVPCELTPGSPEVLVRLTPGMDLRSLRIRPVPAVDARFELIPLDGYANAATMNGSHVVVDGDPSVPVVVDAVPFQRVVARAGGLDHIDVGRSWFWVGGLDGGFSPRSAGTGRWPAATTDNPSRLQLRIRRQTYSKLHLLAAVDADADEVPIITAQFYQPNAGHPSSVEATVQPFAAVTGDAAALPVQLANGKKGRLYRVTLPLDGLPDFSDSDTVELELTKRVLPYRTNPDPVYYSHHAVGRPSSVHVYAMTCELPAVEVTWEPTALAHLWIAPQVPAYRVQLRSHVDKPREVALTFATQSYDGNTRNEVTVQVSVAPGADVTREVTLPLSSYGYHAMTVTVNDGDGPRVNDGAMVLLHADTRDRGDWQAGRGLRFGFWDWRGGHKTLSGTNRLEVMYRTGAESAMRSFAKSDDKEKQWLIDHKMQTPFLYETAISPANLVKQKFKIDWDSGKPDEMTQLIDKALRESASSTPSEVNVPDVAMIFAEPLLGPVSYMSLPRYYGEPDYELTDSEKERMDKYGAEFLIAIKAVEAGWPNAQRLFPWGIANFIIPYLRHRPDIMAHVDGFAVDMASFERLPEMQVGQVTLQNEMWQTQQEWKQHANKPWPKLMTIEGPCVAPSQPAALTPRQEAASNVRHVLALAAYNVDQVLGWPSPSRCAGGWGESHYGAGIVGKLPTLTPTPTTAAYSTMTRQLNRRNYAGFVPTGSQTVFCYVFQHYSSKERVHVLWTIRGRRSVTVAATQLQVTDSMDNSVTIAGVDGKATFTISDLPVYVRGMGEKPIITLGTPDHSDQTPAATATKLGNPATGAWKLSDEKQTYLEESHVETDLHFQGRMTTEPRDVLTTYGSEALAIQFPAQEKDRGTMPYYSSLVPPKPIEIPGRASHLGLWVKANSDWGRVVYVLRDAGGEAWISVGRKGAWNCDDTHSWSRFCFDGWRYLRFELPGNADFDQNRLPGYTWWGHEGGDDNGIVDLPLRLESVIVERRQHVVYANELLPADPGDVLLGDLMAEYADPADMKPEAIRLSRMKMSAPKGLPAINNPLLQFATSTLPATQITKIDPPDREYDGRRCNVFFDSAQGAVSYDIWVSTYKDGRGSVKLGTAWKASGQLLTGLAPNTDLYLFVTYANADGKTSKPSSAFKINLLDMFPMK